MKQGTLSLAAGLGLTLILAVAHALGGRDAVSVLSGTPPEGDAAWLALLGLGYTAAWLATVVLAPPLLVTGAALALRARMEAPRGDARV